jgi:class 3 adenylate cyclase
MGSVETVTLLITDLVGSTGLESRIGPAAAEELRGEHFGLLRGEIERAGGREVKNTGDGLLAAFDRPRRLFRVRSRCSNALSAATARPRSNC